MSKSSGIHERITAYLSRTPTSAVPALQEDWKDPLFQKVAMVTFNNAKYFVSPKTLTEALQARGEVDHEHWEGAKPLTLDSAVWEVLDRLSTGDSRGAAGLQMLMTAVRELHLQDAVVITMILDKTWRNGVTEDLINKAVPGTFRPVSLMLAKKYRDLKVAEQKLIDKGKPHAHVFPWPMVATIKYDGYRAARRPDTGRAISREGNPFPLAPELASALKALTAEVANKYQCEAPALDMELFNGSWKKTAEARATGYTQAIVFGWMPLDGIFGESGPHYNVIEFLDFVAATADRLGIEEQIKPADYFWVSSHKEVDEVFALAIRNGHEGLVLRPRYHPYEGKRSSFWIKVKAEETEDLPIVGKIMGDPRSKNAGKVVGVEVIRDGVISGASGLSEDLMELFTEMGDALTGLVVEVQYHMLTEDGKLRHATVKRPRFDKRGK